MRAFACRRVRIYACVCVCTSVHVCAYVRKQPVDPGVASSYRYQDEHTGARTHQFLECDSVHVDVLHEKLATRDPKNSSKNATQSHITEHYQRRLART